MLAARIVAGRGVNEKVAMVADYGGVVEVVMNFAEGTGADFPGKRRRPGNVDFVGARKEIWLDAVVRGIEEADAVSHKCVAVIIGGERIRSEAPDALIVFLHGHWLG